MDLQGLVETLLAPLIVGNEPIRLDTETTRGGLRIWIRVRVGAKTGERIGYRTLQSLRRIVQAAGLKSGVGVVLDVNR